MRPMAGHVFLVRGDLSRLACDAWALPCDHTFYVSPGWGSSLPEHVLELLRDRRLAIPAPEGWGDDGVRVRRFDEWDAWYNDPQPWLVNTGGTWETEPDWYFEGVREFVHVAGKAGSPPLCGRARRLLGVPLVATGLGGQSDDAGEIVRLLLPELITLAEHSEVDIVLALRNSPAFAAAQHARVQIAPQTDPWAALPPGLAAEAERLGREVALGRLVLFLGAGVSAAAGVPLWDELVDKLAEHAGFTERERHALTELDPGDRAKLIESRLPDNGQPGTRLGALVGEVLAVYRRPSLAHALLASLPLNAAVTTNYDVLFETACHAAGSNPAVLPYESPRDADRWLLKLHGCVNHPEDIVLTRQDYLRYGDRRSALQGIVQALLVTHHMLFVGFSLTDPNFHQIADDVRKALHPDGRTREGSEFGTALTLQPDEIRAELWKHDLVLTAVGEPDAEVADAARLLEIFLDCLVARSGLPTHHLLNAAFDGALTPGERELRDRLWELSQKVSDDARSQPAWQMVQGLLADLGAPNQGLSAM
jgi:SIR2-like protein